MWVFKTFLSHRGIEKKQKTGREEGALPDDGRHLISGAEGQAFARVSHGRMRTAHVNNAIERGGGLIDGNPVVLNKTPLAPSFSPWLSHALASRCASKLRHPPPAN